MVLGVLCNYITCKKCQTVSNFACYCGRHQSGRHKLRICNFWTALITGWPYWLDKSYQKYPFSQWNHSKSWTLSFKKCPSFFAFFCPWRSHLQNETWHCPRCWKRLCKVDQIFCMVLYLPFNRFEPVWSWTDFQRSSPAPESMHRPMYSRSTPLSSFTTEPRPYKPRSEGNFFFGLNC